MSGPVPTDGTANETLVETARIVLQCPIFHSQDEGVVMEVVQFLLEAQRDKHSLWGYCHSVPWPPSFFTSYPETDANAPVAGQGLVLFTADCRTPEHAKSLLKGLRRRLLNLYGKAGHPGVSFSAFIYRGERQDWSSS